MDKLDFIKIENFCASEHITGNIKKVTYRIGEIFANNISDKV